MLRVAQINFCGTCSTRKPTYLNEESDFFPGVLFTLKMMMDANQNWLTSFQNFSLLPAIWLVEKPCIWLKLTSVLAELTDWVWCFYKFNLYFFCCVQLKIYCMQLKMQGKKVVKFISGKQLEFNIFQNIHFKNSNKWVEWFARQLHFKVIILDFKVVELLLENWHSFKSNFSTFFAFLQHIRVWIPHKFSSRKAFTLIKILIIKMSAFGSAEVRPRDRYINKPQFS